MAILHSTSQCRTLTHTYLFKIKTESSLTLKIYDLSQKCISKTTFSFSQLELASKDQFSLSDPSMLLEKIRQKNLIPSESIPSIPTAEECLKDIEQIILQVKPKILFESKELEKFTCPLTLDVFLEPVIDEHGHTFEKSAIEQQLKIKNECPINRQPINSLIPNRDIQQFIEEAQKQDPIPTFALFKRQNTQLASSGLKIAQDYIDAEEYEEALNAYAKAFQYTKDWSDYQQLPHLFDLMKQKDKALLARLYLIQYQLQDKKVQDALQIVEQCRISYPELIQICPLLIKLYRYTGQTSKAIAFALDIGEALAKEHPQEAILVYRQIITEDPYQFKAYPLLASLTKDPREKAHILLKGACHALQKKDYIPARDFCEQAQNLYEDSFIDRLIDLDLFPKRPKPQWLPSNSKLLQIAALYEKKNLPALMIKAYRMLAQLDYDPSYYEKIITGYDQIQKPEKALKWALSYLTLLIEHKEWQQAEKVALQTLARTQKKIPLYEQLETIYTSWHGHELNNLWGKLGKAYSKSGQLIQAEKTYQKAFSQFNSFEHAVALADTLIKLDKKALGVQTYYQASSIALLKNCTEGLSLCVNSVIKVDPDMVHLKLSQRMMLLTQTRLFELSNQTKRQAKLLQETEIRTEHQAKLLKETEIRFIELTKEVKLLKEKIDAPKIVFLPEEKKISIVPSIAFGAAEWKKYFGDVGVEPPLPSNIDQILMGPCPIWPDKKVHETHLLTLIPKTVNGTPLTLKNLGELVQKPLQGNATQYRSFSLGEYSDTPVPASHWILMSRDVIPNSRKKSYKDQQTLAQGCTGYAIPSVLGAAVAIFMEYVRSGTRLYNNNPWTYTSCQEQYNKNWQLVVGGFAPGGLHVSDYYVVGGTEGLGVGVSRKF